MVQLTIQLRIRHFASTLNRWYKLGWSVVNPRREVDWTINSSRRGLERRLVSHTNVESSHQSRHASLLNRKELVRDCDPCSILRFIDFFLSNKVVHAFLELWETCIGAHDTLRRVGSWLGTWRRVAIIRSPWYPQRWGMQGRIPYPILPAPPPPRPTPSRTKCWPIPTAPRLPTRIANASSSWSGKIIIIIFMLFRWNNGENSIKVN